MLINLHKEHNKKSGVYKITNPTNGHFYIGSASVNFGKRFSSHKKLLESNNNPCIILQRAYTKNGGDFEFEVLEICEKGKCLEREQYYIDTLKPKYNVCKIAGNTSGRILTPENIRTHFESMRKFNDDEVISMFAYYNNGMTVTKISNILKCKPNNVSSILNKPNKYKLVKEEYNLVLKNKKIRYKGKYSVTFPNGNVVIVENLTKFAKQNNLDISNLVRFSNKIIKYYKGYKVDKIDI